MSCDDVASNSDLVTFNVGGKIYQVLREPTLSLHPNSLLTQMAEDQTDDKPIFVEGDQDLFKFVIDYHRNRKVHLPINVSKDAIMDELKRFGLEPTAGQIVENGFSVPSLKKKLLEWKLEPAHMLIARAAARVALEKDDGEGFTVGLQDMSNAGFRNADATFGAIFGPVTLSSLRDSVALKDWADTFGYSFTVRTIPPNAENFVSGCVFVDFKPTL
eukprot:Skav230261  [mRNA]  locus=scaffold3387:113644:119036:+ [translate_table: standard]